MNQRKSMLIVLAIAGALGLAACAANVSAPARPVDPPGSAAVDAPAPNVTAVATMMAAPTPEPTPAADVITGPGSFDLDEPAAGLADLPRYRAELRMVFTGTRAGQPYERTVTYTSAVDHDLQARVLRQESNGPDGAVRNWTAGRVGALRFSLLNGADCRTGAWDEDSQGTVSGDFDPASALPRFSGAESAGQAEAAEGPPANIFTFDEHALGLEDGSKAAGRVVATEDGLLVRYELSLTSETRFGEGISGTQTWEYTLYDANEEDLQPPEGCRVDVLALPVPPDAAGLQAYPGVMRYQTALSAAELADFYNTALEADGWKPGGDPVETSGGTRLVYGRVDGESQRVMLITARAGAEGGTSVTVWQAPE